MTNSTICTQLQTQLSALQKDILHAQKMYATFSEHPNQVNWEQARSIVQKVQKEKEALMTTYKEQVYTFMEKWSKRLMREQAEHLLSNMEIADDGKVSITINSKIEVVYPDFHNYNYEFPSIINKVKGKGVLSINNVFGKPVILTGLEEVEGELRLEAAVGLRLESSITNVFLSRLCSVGRLHLFGVGHCSAPLLKSASEIIISRDSESFDAPELEIVQNHFHTRTKVIHCPRLTKMGNIMDMAGLDTPFREAFPLLKTIPPLSECTISNNILSQIKELIAQGLLRESSEEW
ncbi:hypothetical protein HGA88_06645 [Candidatus Roizmanbacteria bacterium]|nr:hypothetical protein [Candidatus Roizmanbacteria bacterium]